MDEEGRPAPIRGLEDGVAARVVSELPPDVGRRILSCLRTAQTLLDIGTSSGGDERFAASATYNLREALGDVTRQRKTVGGLTELLNAWDTYQLACDQPGADEPTARAQLTKVFGPIASDRGRQAYRVKNLVEFVRERTGAEPLAGASDPSRQYGDLLARANNGLHDDISRAEAQELFDEAVAWFVRFFAPPSVVAAEVVAIAGLPCNTERLERFKELGTSNHHLRLFLEHVRDPEWLGHLLDSGLVGLPRPGELWPVASLTVVPRQLPERDIAAFLERMLASALKQPPESRLLCCWEIMRTAWLLGSAGLRVVLDVLQRYPNDDSVQMVAMAATKDVEASSEVQLIVAESVLGREPSHDGGHRTRQVLERLLAGVTPANAADRFALLSRCVARMASETRNVPLLIAGLTTLNPRDGDSLLLTVRALVDAIPTVRSLGVSSASMLQRVSSIPGDLGERIVCQVLSGAGDVDRATKVSHVARRLTSDAATGDDDVLVRELLPFTPEECVELRAALGDPDPAPAPAGDGAEKFGPNWEKAWRWSMVLPAEVLVGWQGVIAALTALYGEIDPSALHRPSSTTIESVSSPISSDDLDALEVVEAAARVAAWRSGPSDPWGTSSLELARALQRSVEQEPARWAADPTAVVRTLREPIYVSHYLRALGASASELKSAAPRIIRAIELVRTERWEPTPLGHRRWESEPDWTGADTSAVELIRALANSDADLEADLQFCWDLAESLVTDLPEDLGDTAQYDDPTRFDDPLHGAINSSYGKALQGVFALAGWEHRRHGVAGSNLTRSLNAALAVGGAVGLQLRAVMAAGRPFLETVATSWLTEHFDELFAHRKSRITLDQTIKYSRPTRYFYDRALQPLLKATRRGTENAASWLLIAYLWDVPTYTYETIVSGLAGTPEALTEVASEIARLGDDVPEDQMEITERAFAFSERLIGDSASGLPASALDGLGRWSLATQVDDRRWLALTERVVDATDGIIDFGVQVAERCRDSQPAEAGLRILTRMLGRGEVWEQHHIERVAVEALRSATRSGLKGDDVDRLREQLIQRGHYDVDGTE